MWPEIAFFALGFMIGAIVSAGVLIHAANKITNEAQEIVERSPVLRSKLQAYSKPTGKRTPKINDDDSMAMRELENS